MPHEPKRRHSKARKGERRASIKLKGAATTSCSNCGATMQAHYVCAICGFYKGKEIIAKTKVKNEKPQ